MTELAFRGSDGCPLYATVVRSTEEAPVGDKPMLVLLHGGGPDHHSLVPLVQQLAGSCTVALPDIRGYGRSICTDPLRHTWSQYASDVVALLDHLGVRSAIVGGAGLGSTISLRTASAYPGRVSALVLISIEDIEDDNAKTAEIAFMEAFAARVREQGIEAAWEPILKDLAPVIGNMVREAIPRSDPATIAAAAAIGRDRAFRNAAELAVISSPTLIIPGMDWRHPTALANELAHILPKSRLARVALTADLQTANDFARLFAPTIRDFLMSSVV
jgi:pimeloyl-ACP methyl ester carboxylesterase